MFGATGRARTQSVLQLEAAECGAASLAMVLGYFGRFAPLDELRTLCGVSRDGAKASSLLKAARSFGLTAKGLKAEPEALRTMKGPMIAFVNFNHFLVVEGVRRNRVYINDPASGRRVETLSEFSDSFTGVVLTFAKGEGFKRGDTRPALIPSLLRRMRGFGGALFFAFLVSLALVVPGILVPFFSQIFVDYILVRSLEDWLVPLLIGMGLTAVARFILIQLQGMTLLRLGEAMTLRNGQDLFQHMMRLPIAFFEQRFSGEIADRVRLNEDLVSLLTAQLTGAALNVITATLFLVAMLTYHPMITLGVAGLAALNVVILAVSTRLMSERFRKISIESGKLTGAKVAGLKDMETFKASGAEDMLYTRWTGLLANLTNGTQAAARASAWLSPLPGLVSIIIGIFVLIAGGYAVMQGQLTLGELVALQSLAASFAAPVTGLAGFGAELQQVRSFTQRLDDIMEQDLDPGFAADRPVRADAVPSGSVQLRDVSFGYSPLEAPLLDGLNLSMHPGQRVALVGTSGSGKSTLGKLITGMAYPSAGTVEIGGRPHAGWTREALAARLAYVRQDVVMFKGTVRENLTLWDDTIPETDLVRAAHDAQIHATIAQRPGGYDAEMTEGGKNFSGGERQRLEIARALATNPSVIVLDEATSALDAMTEHRVMEAIRRRGTTAIVIAHRLSAIRDCDEIIVLDQGQIAEQGRHQDLMAARGLYAHLIEA
ncbi:NHLP family bacteriocin export ABC transporter peptidase/permease/ATPase subunit [Rhodobacteraceae bacterium N5(2021)]|uniref:NHLP family bacteriocin export ABC transporter peptidase/permease/ATPase subunit n=1 Tax=Gymnodinialimonas phycosphaerae TaxID=2841589 RepID=A0A975TXL1_9RHOB|nr:NHLP family bacteriocin export ABC transporter peptidase/permease/ATPase subunit [Gymnodinialimonas phycosphaerae]MBY4891834.1 NHLP family bacteriocin export ABC transporter peptidase/permease/ATPase subunit [Gymnodinialimonas phycosphaerae]